MMVIEIVFSGRFGSLVGFVVALLWLIGLPGQDDEPLAGFVTANWRQLEDQIDNH